jgi:hypothetical protein
LAAWTVSTKGGSTVEFDVTAQVQAALLSDKQLLLNLYASDINNNVASYYSKEAVTGKPQLIISY